MKTLGQPDGLKHGKAYHIFEGVQGPLFLVSILHVQGVYKFLERNESGSIFLVVPFPTLMHSSQSFEETHALFATSFFLAPRC